MVQVTAKERAMEARCAEILTLQQQHLPLSLPLEDLFFAPCLLIHAKYTESVAMCVWYKVSQKKVVKADMSSLGIMEEEEEEEEEGDIPAPPGDAAWWYLWMHSTDWTE
jgi:hypothetical protein